MTLMTSLENPFHHSDDSLLMMLAALFESDPRMAETVEVLKVLPWDTAASTEEVQSYLYVLVEGMAMMMALNQDGRRLATAMLQPGAVFGEESALNFERPGPAYYVQAIKPVKLWRWPRAEARALLERQATLRLALMRTFGTRMLQVEHRLEEAAYRWLPERLAAEILRQSGYLQTSQIRLSHQALADILGTYRETVSAILRDFREAGWVKLGYRRITILDREALERMAGMRRA